MARSATTRDRPCIFGSAHIERIDLSLVDLLSTCLAGHRCIFLLLELLQSHSWHEGSRSV